MVISIDWLQLHLRGAISRSGSYTFKKLPYSTQVFECVEDVYSGSKYIASICSEPRSSVLHKYTVIVKFINSVLYTPELFTTVNSLISSLGLQFIGITRLDVCADFNSFKNGLMPHTLISRFFNMQYRKIGYSKGSCHFQQKTEMKFQTLKFGTGQSVVTSYLYNKSQELNEVKMKPYIVDMWRASGIDTSRDVWRLEFSIKGNGLKLQLDECENPENMSLDNISSTEFITRLYYSLQYSYFRFKIKSSDKNVSRWQDLDLLPPYPTGAKRIFISEAGDGSRADKIFLKKLDQMNNEVRNYAIFRKDFLNEFMCEVAVSKGLADYYLDKINGEATASIKYLKSEQMSAYENILRHSELSIDDNTLFAEDEKRVKLAHVILSTKK